MSKTTDNPRWKYRPCPKCGQDDWFFGRKRFCDSCKAELSRTPESIQKRSAQRAVVTAVRVGKLVRQPCVRCTAQGYRNGWKSHGHHEDYSKPLEVIWLCALHHVQRHLEINAASAA